jgi:hypothetical protein
MGLNKHLGIYTSIASAREEKKGVEMASRKLDKSEEFQRCLREVKSLREVYIHRCNLVENGTYSPRVLHEQDGMLLDVAESRLCDVLMAYYFPEPKRTVDTGKDNG